jgi:hypothetical protein
MYIVERYVSASSSGTLRRRGPSGEPREEALMVEKSSQEIGPRYARGLESEADTPAKHVRPSFARGLAKEVANEEHMHQGEFAVGQERELHHPETGYHGRFARGQEAKEF